MAAAIEQEFGELDVTIAVAVPFRVVDEPAEAHECLFHFLVAVEPFLLAGADVRHPAVGQFLRRIVEPFVLALGERVMIDRGFDKVTGHVAFMVTTAFGRPTRMPAVLRIAQRPRSLQIPIWLLRSQNPGNPILQRRRHQFLRLDNVCVALRIHHQCEAHGLDGLMHPRIGEHVPLMAGVRLATQRLRGLDEIINTALALCQIGAVDVINAVRNPVHNQRLGARVPERTVNLVALRIDDIQSVRGRRQIHNDVQQGGRAQRTVDRRQLEHVLTRCGERRRRFQLVYVGKHDSARPGGLAPGHARPSGSRLQQFHRAGQIRLSAKNHIAILARDDLGRKGGGFPGISNPPFEDAGGERTVRIHLQSQLRGLHFIKRRHVELVARYAQAGHVGYENKVAAVPELHAVCLRQAHTTVVIPPVNLNLLRADRRVKARRRRHNGEIHTGRYHVLSSIGLLLEHDHSGFNGRDVHALRSAVLVGHLPHMANECLRHEIIREAQRVV